MLFASRQDAGRKLGSLLRSRGVQADIVLGLPRGGVIVAAEVARILNLPLDVLLVRKIGHPMQREFAVGALAEADVTLLDNDVVGKNPLVRVQLDEVIREESARLKLYSTKFHHGAVPDLLGKAVLLVDDGLATGSTTEAAVVSAKRRGAASITVAAPVASTHAMERLAPKTNGVVAIEIDPDFEAVGRYYEEFSQTTDAEVLESLAAS